MATTTPSFPDTRPDRPPRTDDFAVVTSRRSLGMNRPQRMGVRLWAPMFVLALVGLTGGLITAFVRSGAVADDPVDLVSLAQLHHVQAGLTFAGMLGVLSAITFAIARILGRFRAGGGDVQQTATGDVQTLRMPTTARLMIGLMALGMMLIAVPVVAHFVVAGGIEATESSLLSQERWFTTLEGARRLGVATYLLGIASGLATIVRVLHFQAIRVRELAGERAARPGG